MLDKVKNKPAISYIHKIHSIRPPFSMDQKESIAWLMKALQRAPETADQGKALNLYERLLSGENIGQRSSVLFDFKKMDWENMELFRPSVRADGSESPWYAPPLQDRMKIFVEESRKLTKRAFQDQSKAPRYIVDISCTGYRAPYPVQEMVLEKGWQSQTALLKIGHMGCYAAIPGLHTAARLSQSIGPEETVSMLNTELCSLHLNPLATDSDQIVSNILFADGCSHTELSPQSRPGSLALIAHYESMVEDSAQYMAWDLEDSRFRMTLSRKVVTQLNRVIGAELKTFLDREGISPRDVTRYAIHPGGPKIIESIQETLGLPEDAVSFSKDVLREHGNMSSATIPHVWKAMQEDDAVRPGEYIVSMAFGPGLTLAMNLLRKM